MIRERKPCPSDLKRELRAIKKAIRKSARRNAVMADLTHEVRKYHELLQAHREGEILFLKHPLAEDRKVPPFGEPSHADD